MDPLRVVHFVMTAKETAAVAAIRGTPQELPSAPFSRATALWLCRTFSGL